MMNATPDYLPLEKSHRVPTLGHRHRRTIMAFHVTRVEGHHRFIMHSLLALYTSLHNRICQCFRHCTQLSTCLALHRSFHALNMFHTERCNEHYSSFRRFRSFHFQTPSPAEYDMIKFECECRASTVKLSPPQRVIFSTLSSDRT